MERKKVESKTLHDFSLQSYMELRFTTTFLGDIKVWCMEKLHMWSSKQDNEERENNYTSDFTGEISVSNDGDLSSTPFTSSVLLNFSICFVLVFSCFSPSTPQHTSSCISHAASISTWLITPCYLIIEVCCRDKCELTVSVLLGSLSRWISNIDWCKIISSSHHVHSDINFIPELTSSNYWLLSSSWSLVASDFGL